MNSQSLQGARSADLRFALAMIALAAGGLAISTTTSKFKTVNTIPYLVDGVFKSKAAATEQSFSSGSVTVPAGYSCIFSIGLDAAGNITTYQGDLFKPEVNNLTGATQYRAYIQATNAAGTVILQKSSKLVDTTSELMIAQPAVPPPGAGVAVGIPDNVLIIGAIKIVAGGSDFVPNTTALTGVATYYDLAGVLPAATVL